MRYLEPGVIHLAAGRLEAAGDALRKALYLAPDHVDAVSHMMALCERRGDKARAVAVHSAGMMEGLRKLYGANALADELEGKK